MQARLRIHPIRIHSVGTKAEMYQKIARMGYVWVTDGQFTGYEEHVKHQNHQPTRLAFVFEKHNSRTRKHKKGEQRAFWKVFEYQVPDFLVGKQKNRNFVWKEKPGNSFTTQLKPSYSVPVN
jgi:hypothetical protein